MDKLSKNPLQCNVYLSLYLVSLEAMNTSINKKHIDFITKLHKMENAKVRGPKNVIAIVIDNAFGYKGVGLKF